jgi:hypothetical protein
MSRNDWDRIGDDLRVGIRAVLASLHSETAVSRPGLYDRAKMLEAVILLEQACTNMELMANGYRMYQPNAPDQRGA